MTGQAATLAGGGRLLSSNRKGFTLAEGATHVAMLNSQRRFGFTLAEVLVTLGIIGVVAALTIPQLISNHRKQEVVTKLEKVYSVMNQAIRTSEAEYGDVAGWAIDCGISGAATCTRDEAKEWFNNYIGKNIQILKIDDDETSNTSFLIYFNDGSILSTSSSLIDWGFYLNEKALNNSIMGKNTFAFRFNPVLVPGQDADRNKYSVKSAFEPYAWNWDGTREGLFTAAYGYGCGESVSNYCAKLIQYEGWNIPKDYPFKF